MEKREAKLYPTELGFLVTDLLVEHFQDIMNVEYTAALEAELDEIEEGKDNLLNTLNQFWKKFEKDLKKASKEMKDVKRMEEQTDEVCDKCGKPMVIKWGRYGSSSPAPAIPIARTRGRWPAPKATAVRSCTKTWPRRSAPTTASRWCSRRAASDLSSPAATIPTAR
jgi:DNA topoisomerase-1